MSSLNPTSPKLYAGAAGNVAGTILATFLIWLLGAGVFDAGWGADRVDNAIAAVPAPLAMIVWLLVSTGGTILAVYLKRDPLRLPTLDADVASQHIAVGSPWRRKAVRE